MTWEITISDDSLQPTDYNISSRRASDDLTPQAPKVRSSHLKVSVANDLTPQSTEGAT